MRRRAESEQAGTSGMRAHHDEIDLAAACDSEDLVACITLGSQLLNVARPFETDRHDAMHTIARLLQHDERVIGGAGAIRRNQLPGGQLF